MRVQPSPPFVAGASGLLRQAVFTATRWSIYWAGFATLAYAAQTLAADNTVTLSGIAISATEASAAESDLADAEETLRQVPGATNLVDMSRVDQGRVSSSEDVFKYRPGIYARTAHNEGSKISIRGSGLNRAPGGHASGLFEMLDGLPLTGPGGTPYELKEPLWLSRVEVYRGANGFDQGSLSLGGAVNYVTHTGYDASPLQLRYEIGSHGYVKRQISSGQVLGNLDYYISLNDSSTDGFQDQTAGGSKGIAANVGYRFSPELETRFYFRYRENDYETPGRLTREQIRHDSTAAVALNVARDNKRIQPGSTWLANKTTYHIDDSSRIEAGLVYHDYPMDLREGANRLKVAYTDISGTLNYIRQDTLFGLASQTTVGLRHTKGLPNNGSSEFVRTPAGNTTGYAPGTRTRDFSYLGSDTTLHASNELEVAPDLWLTTGIAALYTRRETEVTYPDAHDPLSMSEWDYAARLGLRYQINPSLQVYGNLSRSVEPPHAWSMIWGSNKYFPADSGTSSAGLQSGGVELKNQTATTLELGSRGDSWLGQWDLAWYYSQVRHELLSVELQAATATTSSIVAENNASPTVHQGIELGLTSPLWQGPAGKVELRQAYTWNDFRYRDDERFGDNRLPGIPQHYYQAEVRYTHPTGLYVGVNTEHASKVAVDYANSFYADQYTLLGATLGYNSNDGQWQTWLDLRNLTNQRYATTVTPGYDDRGLDAARSTPGEGAGVYAGVSWSLK